MQLRVDITTCKEYSPKVAFVPDVAFCCRALVRILDFGSIKGFSREQHIFIIIFIFN